MRTRRPRCSWQRDAMHVVCTRLRARRPAIADRAHGLVAAGCRAGTHRIHARPLSRPAGAGRSVRLRPAVAPITRRRWPTAAALVVVARGHQCAGGGSRRLSHRRTVGAEVCRQRSDLHADFSSRDRHVVLEVAYPIAGASSHGGSHRRSVCRGCRSASGLRFGIRILDSFSSRDRSGTSAIRSRNARVTDRRMIWAERMANSSLGGGVPSK